MSKAIDKMFSDIHGRYDLMNSVLSFGVDRRWRTIAAKEAIIGKESYKILDIAAGTGEFAIQIAKEAKKNKKHATIYAADYNINMLNMAKSKIKKMRFKNIIFRVEDALDLNFPNNSLDVVTCTFAMRDFDDLSKFVAEIYRVLKPGGKFVLMDMALPDSRRGRLFFSFYSRVMSFLGAFENKKVYDWLIDSIKKFDKKALLNIIKRRGFRDIKMRQLTSGIAYVVTGQKAVS